MSPPTSTPSAEPQVGARRRAWLDRGAAFVLGGVAALVFAIAVALVVILGGLFPADAITPHGPLVGWATHTAMIHSVEHTAEPWPAPAGGFTPAQVDAGFVLYDGHCAMCHGAPGVGRANWTTGLTPTPPYLMDAARQWTPAQLRKIVGDGIKMTAMPAWRSTLSPTDVENIVAFLEALPGVTPQDYQRRRAAAAASRPTSSG